MSCKIEVIDEFKRNFKRLSKKFRTLNEELSELIVELEDNPTLGTVWVQDYIKSVWQVIAKAVVKVEVLG